MLKLVRILFGMILLLNVGERILHSHFYYPTDFLYGHVEALLFLLALLIGIFTVTLSRIWAIPTLIAFALMVKGAPMVIYGLDMVSYPFLLFFCFAHPKKEEQDLNYLASFFLLVQITVMYSYNGWSKFNDEFLWLSGRIFEFIFHDISVLNSLPTRFFSTSVIVLQLSSVLLLVNPVRKIMISFFILFHLLIIVFIGLPYFQTVCILQLICLWNFKVNLSKLWSLGS